MTLDAELVQTVRDYVSRQHGKSFDEMVAFNEGVMAASFALGAFIPVSDISPEARKILETAYESMTRVRISAKRFPTK